jgi:hypothetical protein
VSTIAATIPDNLSFHPGDRVQLEAQVQADGSFLVTRLYHQQTGDSKEKPRISLTEWVRRYAGTMNLEEGESRESLRDSYLAENFGT